MTALEDDQLAFEDTSPSTDEELEALREAYREAHGRDLPDHVYTAIHHRMQLASGATEDT